ncbi:hypothetical protein SBY92_005037 [Candida maltosa Xu316]|uniref:Uncharacterized protein n=1 Tax=Candida maltosa (strain Xu316) TaxID=1245528 RepID=M3HKC3_CANMX|nr:hypothetical protein G210_1701 [Candida maltosa Xu316]
MTTLITTPTTSSTTSTTHWQLLPHKLPIKRIYNPITHEFIQTIRLPHEITEPTNNSETVNIKIKICGINYLSDFTHTNNNSVIPGKRVIGKLAQLPNVKFLVYPYTNCQIENLNHDHNHHYCPLTIGENIHGGLQDTLQVSKRLLIPIPGNVSLHDVCFVFDILLPFFKYSQYIKPEKTIIILNDVEKEMNEVLIVLRHLNIQSNKIVLVDGNSIDDKYLGKFDVVYCFNNKLLNLAKKYCVSTGLESTKSNFLVFSTTPIHGMSDRTNRVMRLTYDDKPLCLTVLRILSVLNKKKEVSSPSSSSSQSPTSGDSDSLVHSTSSTNTSSSVKYHHYSWIHFDHDIDLKNYHNLNLFEEDDEIYQSKIIRQMNDYLNQKKLTRVCYFNRTSKKTLNACII